MPCSCLCPEDAGNSAFRLLEGAVTAALECGVVGGCVQRLPCGHLVLAQILLVQGSLPTHLPVLASDAAGCPPSVWS